MNYRELGNTGLRVSEIGLGCEGLASHDGAWARDFIGLAASAGVNCVDLYSPNPDVRDALGAALKSCGASFVIQGHLCTVWKDGQYERTREIGDVRAGFEDLLARLGRDSVEVGMIHYVDSLADWREVLEGPVMAYARELKAAGKIGHIGLSSHNPEAARAAVESGLVEALMFSVNPCYDLQPASEDVEALWADENYAHPLVNMDPQRQGLYELCARRGVGITVMKAFGGGDLLKGDLSPAGKPLTPWQCLHYALTRPAVSSVMAGARSLEELRECLAYETAPEAERDYAPALAAFPKISWKGHCMYCGHCAPCPQGIDVASVTRFLNLTRAQGAVPETVGDHYRRLEHHAAECLACGACESRCPFEVPVMENMALAREVFGY